MASKDELRERTAPDGKLLGDDVFLNMGQNALQHIARTCMKDYGHKPCLEDFRQLLNTLLCVGLGEYFADGETVEVADVVFVTKPKQPTRSPQEGDIFAIPLGADRCAFGRVLYIKPKYGLLIEVFRETSSDVVYSPSGAASGRLFDPVFVDSYSFGDGRWTILQSDPAYRLSATDAAIKFEEHCEQDEVEEQIREALNQSV